MQIVNNVQIKGSSCSHKHDPAHFTVLKHFSVWMVWSFWKTFKIMAGPCSPKHDTVLFKVLKNLFVWILCSRLKTFKFMARPRSPTSPVTAQLISRRWKTFSSWSYADFPQRSNERLDMLPQTRFNWFHDVEEVISLNGRKLFKNIWS